MNLNSDYFTLFGLKQQFAVDTAALDAAYRQIQSQVHPDRFAQASDTEKRLALQWATHANEAYQTLKHPISRGRYLLQLAGVDTAEEQNTAMPTAFLMAQMEWREAIEEAQTGHDVSQLEKLLAALHDDSQALIEQLAHCLDHDPDLPQAALLVRKLRFLDKLEQDISDAIEGLLF